MGGLRMRRKKNQQYPACGGGSVSLLSGCGSRGEETAADIPQSESLQTEAAEESQKEEAAEKPRAGKRTQAL